MYEAGKWYRQYYKDKISAGYRYDLLTMNSTSQDRALMSAEAFLAGMFPPLENETWADDGLQWQPIPVHTENEDVRVHSQYSHQIPGVIDKLVYNLV